MDVHKFVWLVSLMIFTPFRYPKSLRFSLHVKGASVCIAGSYETLAQTISHSKYHFLLFYCPTASCPQILQVQAGDAVLDDLQVQAGDATYDDLHI